MFSRARYDKACEDVLLSVPNSWREVEVKNDHRCRLMRFHVDKLETIEGQLEGDILGTPKHAKLLSEIVGKACHRKHLAAGLRTHVVIVGTTQGSGLCPRSHIGT